MIVQGTMNNGCLVSKLVRAMGGSNGREGLM